MFDIQIIPIAAFLLLILMVYLWASQRNLAKNRVSSPQEYLWKLKQITGKSEYELFHIAAREKGWPDYHVERHFKRYLEDQTLPEYVKEFLADGQEFINQYRPPRGNFFDRKVLVFFSFFTTLIIGGSFIFCIYIFPRIYPYNDYAPNLVLIRSFKENPRFASAYIERASSLGFMNFVENACIGLEQACESGTCEYYDEKRRQGVCQ